MKISISQELQETLPNFNVIGYTMDVDNKTTIEVTNFINNLFLSLKDKYTLEQLIKEPKILESRNAYKKLGKDPSHTRVACENLWRRLIKGQKFYRLGDLIDLGNVLSILTKRSVCVVDLDKIDGDIFIRRGTKDDIYETINRGLLNVENIPLYVDLISPFGCPSSDTLRTSITKNTKRILIMIICFSKNEINEDELLLLDIYQKYTKAKNIIKIS